MLLPWWRLQEPAEVETGSLIPRPLTNRQGYRPTTGHQAAEGAHLRRRCWPTDGALPFRHSARTTHASVTVWEPMRPCRLSSASPKRSCHAHIGTYGRPPGCGTMPHHDDATERLRMKCLNCGSDNLTSSLAVEDDGAYPAGNHKVTTRHGRSRASKASGTRLAARACLECGFTALFAEDPSALSE